jgi:hypothetical protein
LEDMPVALTPELIQKKRVPALIANNELPLIERLTEINFYYLKGFIDEATKVDAFEQLAGQEGKAIAEGASEAKQEAAEKLVEKQLK